MIFSINWGNGSPALPADFSHMPYANPDAPKGGRLVQGILGTFDSLNPLIVKGLAVQQIRGFVIESLLARGNDEPFTLYGLLADSVETDDARTEVTFHLNPLARFSDGRPVLADDVLFSLNARPDGSIDVRGRAHVDKEEAARLLDEFVRLGPGDLEMAGSIALVDSEKAVERAWQLGQSGG